MNDFIKLELHESLAVHFRLNIRGTLLFPTHLASGNIDNSVSFS